MVLLYIYDLYSTFMVHDNKMPQRTVLVTELGDQVSPPSVGRNLSDPGVHLCGRRESTLRGASGAGVWSKVNRLGAPPSANSVPPALPWGHLRAHVPAHAGPAVHQVSTKSMLPPGSTGLPTGFTRTCTPGVSCCWMLSLLEYGGLAGSVSCFCCCFRPLCTIN